MVTMATDFLQFTCMTRDFAYNLKIDYFPNLFYRLCDMQPASPLNKIKISQVQVLLPWQPNAYWPLDDKYFGSDSQRFVQTMA